MATTGLSVLSGTAATFVPGAGQVLAILGMSLAEVLALYGGSQNAPQPALTGEQVDQIIGQHLLKQDVRDAWAMISPAYDWYEGWTIRAKSGEQFTQADLDSFDAGYEQVMGPNSSLRSGLAKLYTKPPNVGTTPGQYGVPYLIVGVGLWIQLLNLDIARTAEKHEAVSDGQWQILQSWLQIWLDGLHDCDYLASGRVMEALKSQQEKDPSIQPGTPKYAAALKQLEIEYHGGASADGELPALTAQNKITRMQLSLEAAGKIPASPSAG